LSNGLALAQSGHPAALNQCLLLGVKRNILLILFVVVARFAHFLP
jgi:hypothetical protein